MPDPDPTCLDIEMVSLFVIERRSPSHPVMLIWLGPEVALLWRSIYHFLVTKR